MKTESLIDMLARQAGPAPRALAARRLTPAVAGGLVLAVAGALAWIGPIPAELYADPGPWIKFGYAGLLAAAALWWVARLGRPAAPVRRTGARGRRRGGADGLAGGRDAAGRAWR